MIVVFNPTTGARAELHKLTGRSTTSTWRWLIQYRGRQVLDGQCTVDTVTDQAMTALAKAITAAATTPTLNEAAQNAIRGLVHEL